MGADRVLPEGRSTRTALSNLQNSCFVDTQSEEVRECDINEPDARHQMFIFPCFSTSISTSPHCTSASLASFPQIARAITMPKKYIVLGGPNAGHTYHAVENM